MTDQKLYITDVRPADGAIKEYYCWLENTKTKEFEDMGWNERYYIVQHLRSGRAYTAFDKGDTLIHGAELDIFVRAKPDEDIRLTLTDLQERHGKKKLSKRRSE